MWKVTDSTLCKDVPVDTIVVRTYTGEPRADSGVLHRLLFAFPNFPPWIPDESMAWLPWFVPAALREIRRHLAQVIYATGGPFSVLVLGAVLKSLTSLPLVVDFRDEWMLDPAFMQGRGPQRRWWFFLDYALQDWVVRQADRVVLVSDHAREVFKRRYELYSMDKFVTIRNGYDPADFEAAILPSLPPDKLNIALVGTPSIREFRPETFFRGMRLAIDMDESFRNLIRVFFVGGEDIPSQLSCAEEGLDSYVTFLGYHAHHESVGFLKQADLLLLISRSFPVDNNRITCRVPGKLYEYLGSGKRVLVLAPRDSEALGLLEKANLAFWADPEDPTDIARMLIHLEGLWRRGALKVDPNWAFIRTLTRQRQAEQLAGVLDAVLESRC